MGKIAFIFPGQGAQYVGMGKELYNEFNEVKEVYDEASSVLGRDMAKLCFEGPEDELLLTRNTQPAILTTSIAVSKILENKNISADITAGLSLGEYAALVNAGALSFADAVKLVEKRGAYMQEAVPAGLGSMVALIGISRADAEKLCIDLSEYGIIEISNYNCPGQIVIGGEILPIKKSLEVAANYGASRAIELSVSAPFHTSMLKPAAENLEKDLNKINFSIPEIPVVQNVHAKIVTGKDDFIQTLKNQVASSVMWEDSVNTMIAFGADTFIEIGPGKVLSGFVKKIDKNLNIMNIEDIKSLKQTISKLEI